MTGLRSSIRDPGHPPHLALCRPQQGVASARDASSHDVTIMQCTTSIGARRTRLPAKFQLSIHTEWQG